MKYLIAIKAEDGTPIFEFDTKADRQAFQEAFEKDHEGYNYEIATAEIEI